MKNVLIVEDDVILNEGITIAVKSDEIDVTQVYSIEELRTQELDKVDLIVLDVNLPDGNGIQFLKELRTRSNIPVIVLTANDMESDVIVGLEVGANDYVTKPCSLAILRARVNAQFRQTVINKCDKFDTEDIELIDDFYFNFTSMEFKKKDEPIELSKTEQKLLYILIKNKNKTIEKGTLVDRLWTDGAQYVDENALSVSIKRLRNKLEDDSSKPQYIKNVYGVGYLWAVKE